MFEQLKASFRLSRGEKAYLLAYAVVISGAGALTLVLMAQLEVTNVQGIPLVVGLQRAAFAGFLGGALALYSARGWMGLPGPLGLARAVVGSTAAALIAAVIAGTLIMPVYGTFFAPVMLVTAFIAQPLLAIVWYAMMLGAHEMMIILSKERMGQTRPDDKAGKTKLSASLSALSQAQLFHMHD